MEYNEQDAVKHILAALPADRGYSEDEVLNVIDIIWDFYEESGLLDPATAFDDDDDEAAEEREMQDLIKHVKKMLAKDMGSNIRLEDVEAIITAEIDYENSII